ncbi:PREDICTED: uncharacterized protein LOC106812223 [Priapulus caudatus]|uniref:Uncharacterized protein LOC106812223 n=1 Tax=Priapulus caudatus TaxID=37621 RepID=A0ABM1EH70_PRICU|nr:PREDICTED: uncharacterized protein LOC106812223 [Priapulus caudatus]
MQHPGYPRHLVQTQRPAQMQHPGYLQHPGYPRQPVQTQHPDQMQHPGHMQHPGYSQHPGQVQHLGYPQHPGYLHSGIAPQSEQQGYCHQTAPGMQPQHGAGRATVTQLHYHHQQAQELQQHLQQLQLQQQQLPEPTDMVAPSDRSAYAGQPKSAYQPNTHSHFKVLPETDIRDVKDFDPIHHELTSPDPDREDDRENGEEAAGERKPLELAMHDIKTAIKRSKSAQLRSPVVEQTQEKPVWVLRDSYVQKVRREADRRRREELDQKKPCVRLHGDDDAEAEDAPRSSVGGGGGEEEDDVEEELARLPREQSDEDSGTDAETDQLLGQKREYYDDRAEARPPRSDKTNNGQHPRTKEGEEESLYMHEPAVLIEGVLFRAHSLGSTQLFCRGPQSKGTRMMQAQEAVSRIKAPEGESQPSTEVDLFISTEKIMVLNTDLQEIMMDHALRTISYIADIGELIVIMARRRVMTDEKSGKVVVGQQAKMICHVFESEEAQLIAQSIGQAFQVAYVEFLKANGIEDPNILREMDYQEVLNSQEIPGDELNMFASKEQQKEIIVPKQRGEILGVVIVESGWGSMLPTVVIANMCPQGAAARCGQINIGDQIISLNGVSLVGLPLSSCQNYIKGGVLSRQSIFYKQTLDTVEMLFNPNHHHDTDVLEFHNTIEYLGGRKTANFIRGPMFIGASDGYKDRIATNAKLNLGGPSRKARKSIASGYTTKGGIISSYLSTFLTLANAVDSQVVPIVDNQAVKVFPTSYAIDGTALKAGFEVDEKTKLVIGGKDDYNIMFVKANPNPSPEFLRDNVVTEANVGFLTSMCNNLSMPVGVDYFMKAGKTGAFLSNLFVQHIMTIQTCQVCVKQMNTIGLPVHCENVCQSCLDTKEVCETCALSGQSSYKPPLRACKVCIDMGQQCVRCVVFVVTTDCESGNKAALEDIEGKVNAGTINPMLSELCVLPDCVHVGKSLKCSFSNWYLLLSGERSNLSILRTLRDDANPVVRKTLRRLLTLDAVQNKDRMAVDVVLHLTKDTVLNTLRSIDLVVHDLVPERYRLQDDNKPGMYPHPIDVEYDQHGSILFLDYNPMKKTSKLLKGRLHNPVQVQVLKDDLKDAWSITLAGGICFICHKDERISFVEVHDKVAIRLSSLVSKASVYEHLVAIGLPHHGTMADMKRRLGMHISRKDTEYNESTLTRQRLSTKFY